MIVIDQEETKQAYDEIFSKPLTFGRVLPNPVIYDNEPYKPSQTIADLVNDYMNDLNIIRQMYLDTGNTDLARLLMDLIPAAVYSSLN